MIDNDFEIKNERSVGATSSAYKIDSIIVKNKRFRITSLINYLMFSAAFSVIVFLIFNISAIADLYNMFAGVDMRQIVL